MEATVCGIAVDAPGLAGGAAGTGVDVAIASSVADMAASIRRASRVAATPAAILSASDLVSGCWAQPDNASKLTATTRQYLIINQPSLDRFGTKRVSSNCPVIPAKAGI